MTIKELIARLNEAARDSKKGENAIVEIYAEEKGQFEILEVYVTVSEDVIIR